MELQSKKQVWSLQEHSQTNEMQTIVSSVNVEKYIGGAVCVDVCVGGGGGGGRVEGEREREKHKIKNSATWHVLFKHTEYNFSNSLFSFVWV